MTPKEILTIREQCDFLMAQAKETKEQSPAVCESLRSAATALYKSIKPYCWGCGRLLSPLDYGDRLCNICIKWLPVQYPD